MFKVYIPFLWGGRTNNSVLSFNVRVLSLRLCVAPRRHLITDKSVLVSPVGIIFSELFVFK